MRALALGPARKLDDLFCIAGKVADSGIDLCERYSHTISLNRPPKPTYIWSDVSS